MADDALNLNDRLKFMKFDDRSRALLRDMRPLLKQNIGDALSAFYSQIRATPEMRRHFSDDHAMDAAKGRQSSHWDALAAADFDDAYVKNVRAVGATHARIGLEPRWYIGGYAIIVEQLIKALVSDRESSLLKRMKNNPEELGDAVVALVKAALLDMDLAISTYLDGLQKQREKAEAERAQAATHQFEALGALTASLSELAAGNLLSRIEAALSPEFSQLKQDFNSTTAKLQDVVGSVVSSMVTIEGGNREIAQASDDLARRTEQQAASLEQTTAALSQITDGVKATTDSVRHARTVAETATKDAARTSDIVSRSKAAMEEIQKATAKIGQITDVIDEIAFQTNLLALNAGVEAARAGESGRGFAVVATEVRSLAQRASDSAKDIKELIDHATATVAEGADLVSNTDDALSRFVTQVSEITTIIGNISETAQEQTTGLTEVNIAIGDLDRSTQQNAAMVEQSTAATQSLSQEASKLSAHLSFFKVAQRTGQGVLRPAAQRQRSAPPSPQPARAQRAVGGRPRAPVADDGWTEF